jgi:catechol 2,3-dioxygenase-like lactoylglutathione lyase family enzyme
MNAVSHVAIGVRDMERSLRFYRDLLGLEVMSDQTQPKHGCCRHPS